MTSREPEDALNSDIVLDPAVADFAETGLSIRSVIRTHRLLTVSSSLIKREIGRLSDQRLAEVSQKVRGLFEVPEAN